MKQDNGPSHLLKLYEELLELAQRQLAVLTEGAIEELPGLFSERERCMGMIQRALEKDPSSSSDQSRSRVTPVIEKLLAVDEELRIQLEGKKEEVLTRLKNIRQGQKLLKAYKPARVHIPKFIETKK